MLQRFRPSLLLAAATALVALLPHHVAEAVAVPTGKEIASKSDCFGCHAIAVGDPKKMGPNYGAIANKYPADKKTNELLVSAIRKGSSGHWGTLAMPPHPQMSEADAKTVAAWIMSLKPGKPVKADKPVKP